MRLPFGEVHHHFLYDHCHQAHLPPPPHLQQPGGARAICSSPSAAAAAKGGGARAAKGAVASKSGKASSSDSGSESDRSPRTPEWAREPVRLDELRQAFRDRSRRLAAAQRTLEGEEAKLRKRVEAASGRHRAEVEAEAERAGRAAAAVPVAAMDGLQQASKLVAAAASFQPLCAGLAGLVRRGVVLDAAAHLVPLLRLAVSASDLTAAFLPLLRANHLAQAARRLGAHGPAHTALHGALVQECQRLGSAAPLLELWDSLHEHGVEPGRQQAVEAVRGAVELRDAGAAAALLVLGCQYGLEPLVEGEQAAVLALLQEVNPDEAARLRDLLPRLGLRAG